MEKEHLSLKWGTVKGWSNFSDNSIKIVERLYEDGMPMSVMMDRLDEKRREILCELIDQLDGTIYNEWEGKEMTKAQAKKYVREYGKE